MNAIADVVPTVLVVDDQSEVRKLLRMILAHEKYNLVEAVDGPSAISKLKECNPQLMLLDVMMPGHPNGLELLEIIKRDKGASIKVIIVSAKGQYEDVSAAARLSCDAYVVKPFTRTHLTETVRKVLMVP